MITLHDRIKEYSSELIKDFEEDVSSGKIITTNNKNNGIVSHKKSVSDISDNFYIFDRCEVIYNCDDSQFYVHYFLNNFMCVLYCHINEAIYYTPHFLDDVVDSAIKSVYDITNEEELMIRFEHDAKYRYST